MVCLGICETVFAIGTLEIQKFRFTGSYRSRGQVSVFFDYVHVLFSQDLNILYWTQLHPATGRLGISFYSDGAIDSPYLQCDGICSVHERFTVWKLGICTHSADVWVCFFKYFAIFMTYESKCVRLKLLKVVCASFLGGWFSRAYLKECMAIYAKGVPEILSLLKIQVEHSQMRCEIGIYPIR